MRHRCVKVRSMACNASLNSPLNSPDDWLRYEHRWIHLQRLLTENEDVLLALIAHNLIALACTRIGASVRARTGARKGAGAGARRRARRTGKGPF